MSKNKTTSGATEAILEEVAFERLNQDAQWGQQDHGSIFSETNRKQAEVNAEMYRNINAARVEIDSLTWDGILLEEVYEAIAESEPSLRRAELVQVAAVAVAEIEALDRLVAELESQEQDEESEDDAA